MRNPEKSLQNAPTNGVLVTETSRNEAVNHFILLHDLLSQLPLRWHSTQITSKGVFIKLTLSTNRSFHFGSGETFSIAFLDLKQRLLNRGIIA
ncbi:MAG: hypothetical protein ACPGSD_00005 [Flavobacteriales bacterium]